MFDLQVPRSDNEKFALYQHPCPAPASGLAPITSTRKPGRVPTDSADSQNSLCPPGHFGGFAMWFWRHGPGYSKMNWRLLYERKESSENLAD